MRDFIVEASVFWIFVLAFHYLPGSTQWRQAGLPHAQLLVWA
ncbi:MAG TPA: hypothetical protein VLV83_27420 [Acidobacteriota bacterium]|nr:hypothetical protein [Acidobacteriota bacterium]